MKFVITTLAVASMVAPQVLAAPVPAPGLSDWMSYVKGLFSGDAPALTDSQKLERAKTISEDYGYILEAPRTEEEVAALKEAALKKKAAADKATLERKQKIQADPEAFKAYQNKVHGGFSLADLTKPSEKVFHDYDFIPEVRKEMLKRKKAAEEARNAARVQNLQERNTAEAMRHLQQIHSGFNGNYNSDW